MIEKKLKKEMIILLIRFLKEQNANQIYYYNVIDQREYKNFLVLVMKDNLVNDGAELISHLFIWRLTRQGFTFWQQIFNKWKKVIESNHQTMIH